MLAESATSICVRIRWRRQRGSEARDGRAISRVDVAGDWHDACALHPLRGQKCGRRVGYDVPLISGDHVTDEAGTGFVHTAPSHGDDDYRAVGEHNWPTVTYNIMDDGRFLALICRSVGGKCDPRTARAKRATRNGGHRQAGRGRRHCLRAGGDA